ncbi:MAG: succinate dehydrogenase, cytochrome b556 subunit [Pseudomonadota bacterium]
MAASPLPHADKPLSPHLQIWRFTVTMAASITHRGTGVALYAGTALLAFWLIAVAQGPGFFYPIGGFLTSLPGMAILGGYIWALSFHLMNGLRYLYWDSGRGFDPKMARMTSWLVYVGSIALTALIFFLGYSARGGV